MESWYYENAAALAAEAEYIARRGIPGSNLTLQHEHTSPTEDIFARTLERPEKMGEEFYLALDQALNSHPNG